jgi:hypothetical protein
MTPKPAKTEGPITKYAFVSRLFHEANRYIHYQGFGKGNI